ncbi:hypothetical protein MJN69_28320, partial [Salmonella enterica subsp. enterica serovar Kentucky]|nr:hypothetical protein [Salmonella enterica subsp. enterica serovar Kentucky]
DSCVEIASHPEVIFCTFGDAMRVPGKQGSLLQAKARGADVRIWPRLINIIFSLRVALIQTISDLSGHLFSILCPVRRNGRQTVF